MEELQRVVAAQKFHATLKPRLDAELVAFVAEQERLDPAPQPTITHEPINDQLQTGASRALGGAIRITAPWKGKRND